MLLLVVLVVVVLLVVLARSFGCLREDEGVFEVELLYLF